MTFTELMCLSDQDYFELLEEATLMDKKQVQKGIEIELQRLAIMEADLRKELKSCSEYNEDKFKTLLELQRLFTRMEIRQQYAKYINKKDAKALMQIK